MGLLLLVAACKDGFSPGAGAASELAPPGVLQVASSLPPGLTAALVQQLRPRLNAEVRVRPFTDAASLSAHHADLILTHDVQQLLGLEAAGKLLPLSSQVLLRLPPALRSPAGRWLALGARTRVWAYDARRLRAVALPAGMRGWTEAQWRGRLGWAPGSLGFRQSIAGLLQRQGRQETEDWLRLMQANQPVVAASDAALLEGIRSRRIDVAWVDHPSLPSALLSGGMAAYLPREQRALPLLAFSGAAVLSQAHQPALAQRLLSFLLAKEGQSLLHDGSGERPLAASALVLPRDDGLLDWPSMLRRAQVADLQNLDAAEDAMRQAGLAW